MPVIIHGCFFTLVIRGTVSRSLDKARRIAFINGKSAQVVLHRVIINHFQGHSLYYRTDNPLAVNYADKYRILIARDAECLRLN